MDITKFTPEQLALFTPEQLAILTENKKPKLSEDKTSPISLDEFTYLTELYEYEIGNKTLNTFATKPFDKELLDYLRDKLHNVFLKNSIMVVVDKNISMDSFTKKETTREKALALNDILHFKDITVLNKLLPRLLNYIDSYNKIIFSPNDEKGCINLWRQNEIKKTEVEGFKHIEFLIKQIFSEESYDFALAYINSVVNYYEHDKVPTISSFEGMGKGVFRRLIGFLTHECRVYEDRPTVLTAPFNDQLFGKALVVINEIGKTEFTKVKDTLKDSTGKEYIEIKKKYLDPFRTDRTQQYMIFTNKQGIENFLDDSQRRFVIIDNNNTGKKKLDIAVREEFNLTVREFIEMMKKELYNFNEFLRTKKVICSYEGIDKSTINLINKSDNFAIRFLKALATNDVEEGDELLRKYKEYSSDFVEQLFTEAHKGTHISTSLVNNILLTIQPTFNSRHQLLKTPYKEVIEDYFNVKNNRNNTLKISGTHSKTVIKCDKVTKKVLTIKTTIDNKATNHNDDDAFDFLK